MAKLRCPICHQPFDIDGTPAMPFCSDRCRQIDLGRWLEERMTLPGDPEQEQLDEAEE